ncbi:MAG: inorganic phosphate transporter, partial [Ignavibacteriaceae bacterium]
DHIFRKGQLISASLYSLGHGGNDAQKTMGIIGGLLFSAHLLNSFYIPLWVVLSCQAAMACGTMFGGWKIVKTMGQRVAKIKPVDGFCAETAAAITLFLSTALGIPVSTTHTITGAITGVGSIKGLTAVRWSVAGKIVWAWIFTIPISAAISAAAYFIASII